MDWDSLYRYQFKRIRITFSNEKIAIINRSDFDELYRIKEFEKFNYYYIRSLRDRSLWGDARLDNKPINKIIDFFRNELCADKESHFAYLAMRDLSRTSLVKKITQAVRAIDENFLATILYLPTYRRIEEQWKNIIRSTRKNTILEVEDDSPLYKKDNDRVLELVEFGMGDVEELVSNYRNRLLNFSASKQKKLSEDYLRDILLEKYSQMTLEEIGLLSEKYIDKALDRMREEVLTSDEKESIKEIILSVINRNNLPSNIREKIVCHYIVKLVSIDREIANEERLMREFVESCNGYLENNYLEYDSKKFNCRVLHAESSGEHEKREISFQEMSSGEKQIVSIFGHLNLSKDRKFFVFIDEPELSLSVNWQRRFLKDILESSQCIGLFATTHSPFIFENSLEEYVFGIDEFSLN